ncbi:MAG: hypothetical protein NE334_01115 [Lentisphaeraceae bacterium]|nr:hypothetical protein [Lentisphaeraceae bacterium]
MRYILILFIQTIFLFGGESLTLTKVELPDLTSVSVSGLCEDHSGGIKFSTSHGDIWSLKEGGLSLYASGLQDPTGLLKSWREGQYFALQRSEISKLVDENRDDKADLFESFGKGWGFTGNSSEKVTALANDIDGNYYAATSLSLSADGYANMGVKRRGVVFKVDYIGESSVYATGIENVVAAEVTTDSELVLASNKSAYQFSAALYHVEEGDFLGNPLSLKEDKTKSSLLPKIMRSQGKDRIAKFAQLRKLPSVVFPATAELGDMEMDQTEEKLGPYAGQLFITDTSGLLYRAHLDKVGDVVQGAVFTMAKDLPKALGEVLINAEGQFYFGQNVVTDQPSSGGLFKAELNKSGFDLKEMKVIQGGFKLEFTQPLKSFEEIDVSIAKYEFVSSKSGSMGEFKQAKPSFKLSADKLSLTILLKDLEPQTVVKVNCEKLMSADGKPSLSSMAYYTLNKIP